MNAVKRFFALAVAMIASIVAAPLYAQTTGLDYSDITGAVDLTTTIAAVMTIGGILALIAVAVMGVRKVLRMIK